MVDSALPTKFSPEAKEPYTNWPQQHETAQSGMWLFLSTEVMFFGGLFAAYSVYRYLYPTTFQELSRHLDVPLGTLNTGILLTSSFTMAMAVHAAQERKPSAILARRLLYTFLLGLLFIAIKTKEWMDDYAHGLFPGHWTYSGPNSETGELFFYTYYAMVGLHALHVLIGMGLLLVFAIRARGGRFSQGNFTPIQVLGLYWHYVDLVWIFLYPLFYLVDPI